MKVYKINLYLSKMDMSEAAHIIYIYELNKYSRSLSSKITATKPYQLTRILNVYFNINCSGQVNNICCKKLYTIPTHLSI